MISTFCFILSTFPELQEEENDVNNNETETSSPPIDIDSLIPDEPPSIDFGTVRLVLRAIDMVTVCYFFMEYVVRFLCSPKKIKFFFQVKTTYRSLYITL